MNKLKICFINPPHPYLKQPKAQAPLGLLYVASAARNINTTDISVVDLGGFKYNDNLSLPEADIYGLTGTVLDRKPCSITAEYIRSKYPKAKIIIGGPIHLAAKDLDTSLFDSVVFGEGEYIIKQIIEDFPNVHSSYTGERIHDLDSLAFPARDLIDNIGGNVFAYNQNYFKGGSSVIITSRGCPFACAFCASPGIWGGKQVIFRSVENVLDEVDVLINDFGIKQLRFSDDTLTANTKRLLRLCRGLKDRGVVWRASIRVKPNDISMFSEMYKSGCREVSFGIESGDQKVLDTILKKTTVEDNIQAVKNAKKAGLVVRLLFMCGTPGETETTADNNIKFLETIKNDYDTIALTNFIPIPGSAIADKPDQFDCKILNDNIDDFNFYMWGPEGENKWNNMISLNNLDNSIFQKNIQKIRNYVKSCGKSNQG